jgi:hypothetical protein
MLTMKTLWRASAVTLAIAMLSGCSEVRQHVRQYDFREMNRAAAREKAVPSPVADVLDMDGWTSDFDGATAFARVNRQRTIVFFYGQGSASEKAKRAVDAVVRRMSDVQKVALDITKKKGIASRLGVDRAPAIVVLDPSGRVVTREQGALTRDAISSAIGS